MVVGQDRSLPKSRAPVVNVVKKLPFVMKLRCNAHIVVTQKNFSTDKGNVIKVFYRVE